MESKKTIKKQKGGKIWRIQKFYPKEIYSESELINILQTEDICDFYSKTEKLEEKGILKKFYLIRGKKSLSFSERMTFEELQKFNQNLKLSGISFSAYYFQCEFWEVLMECEKKDIR